MKSTFLAAAIGLVSTSALAYTISPFDLSFRAYRGGFKSLTVNGDRIGSYGVFCQNYREHRNDLVKAIAFYAFQQGLLGPETVRFEGDYDSRYERDRYRRGSDYGYEDGYGQDEGYQDPDRGIRYREPVRRDSFDLDAYDFDGGYLNSLRMQIRSTCDD